MIEIWQIAIIAFTILIVYQLSELVCDRSKIRACDIRFKQMVKRDVDEMIRRGTRPVITTNFDGFYLQDMKNL